MIRLSGQNYPDDIDIVFTGLRPGEKLYEELFYETEQNACRVHEKIYRSPREAMIDVDVVKTELELLSDHLHASRDELREVVWQITARIVENSSSAVPATLPVRARAGKREAA